MLSQPCRAVMLFILANKIPCEDRRVNLAVGEHLTAEFSKLNPFHKVPVIDDNGFIVKESVAILRYLSYEKNVPDHWYPKDRKQQAKIDEYLEWQHLDTRLNCSMYFIVKFLRPLITGQTPSKKIISEYEDKMKRTLDMIETIWLKSTPYLIGDNITIADLFGVCELEQPRMAGYDPCTDRPQVTAWMNRIREEMNPHYDKLHERVNKIATKAPGSIVPDNFPKV
ncbi:hypothetical protein L9F63_012623 [Diploptera punctata]|uniref:glutathione transferase n=1 Tax=Diploptera punctata TaxID=6984 RepID=A0AAD8AEC7_DIPPU|nr:hypothetical protein L9F63_012623 [Diploptera punctata]